MDITILVVSVAASGLTGLFVLMRNPKHVVNRIYGFLALVLVLISVTNHFSLHSTHQLFFIRTVVFFAALLLAGLYYLVYFLDNAQAPFSRWLKAGIALTAVVAVLNLTPLVFSRLEGTPDQPAPVPNVGITLFGLQMAVFLTATAVLLVRRLLRASGIERMQYAYLLFAALPFLLLAPITSFVLPVFLSDVSLVALVPVYNALFTGMVGYAIVKHRLFDIKLVALRFLVYALAIAVLSSVYGFVSFGLALAAFQERFPITEIIFFSLATGLAATSFKYLRSWFDRISNRLFYQDAYSPQDFFSEFNSALVSTIEAEKLLTAVNSVLNTYLKPEFCAVSIHGGPFASLGRWQATSADVASLCEASTRMNMPIAVADNLGQEAGELRTLLAAHKTAVLVRLVAKEGDKTKELGCIILGFKKSGNIYNNQDAHVLQAAADELTIAIQNALSFDKLQAVDNMKTEFIILASHNLRTPISVMSGSTELLESTQGLSEVQARAVSGMRAGVDELGRFVDDLLAINSMQAGGPLSMEPIAVDELLAPLLEETRQRVEAKQLKLIVQNKAADTSVRVNRVLFCEALRKVLENAIEFTKEGSITVEAARQANRLTIAVTDTGIGIPEAEQPKLFTTFHRGTDPLVYDHDGKGLGLYFAKLVLEAHGGSISLSSEDGKGVRVELSLAL